jgi:hypothetical protein
MHFCAEFSDIFSLVPFTTFLLLAILTSLYLPAIRPGRALQVNPDVSLRLEQHPAPQLTVCTCD